jgi:hypothetical protein
LLAGTLIAWVTPIYGQRGLTPEWVDATPEGKLVVKAWDFAGGKAVIRGGMLIRPGVKALFMKQSSKPENMDVDLFLDVSNRSPNTLWVEMEIEVPGQKKGSAKLVELKEGRGWWQAWNIKELQWGFQYPVRISAYADKKKSSVLGTTNTSIVFDEADKVRLEAAKSLATKQWHEDRFTWVTMSGWPEKAPAQTAGPAEEMVEGTVANALLQKDIREMIQSIEGASHPGCELQIVKQLRSASKPGTERWMVKSCDAASTYEVLMVPSPKGGTDFKVRLATDTTAQASTGGAAKERKLIEGKPPFEWDAKNSSAELALTYEEKKRSKMPGVRGTAIEYDIRAAGFSPEEELTLWMKWLDGKHAGFPVVRAKDGLLQMMHEGNPLATSLMSAGFIAGEPLAIALHSSTSGKRAFTKVVFFPIAAQGAGGCSVGAELRAPSGLLFLITFRGFTPEEEVQVVSQYKKEKIPHAVKTSASGESSLPVLFGPGDKGKATITVTGKACSASLEYKIGKDALVVQ